MSSIAEKLLESLRSVERSGGFCVGGVRDVLMPAIEVEGVGRIAFPVLPAQAEALVAAAEAAPYGRGEETVVDRDVRRTWQIDPAMIRLGGRHWEKTLGGLVAEAALGLGVNEPVAADFYKLLVYDAGSFFVEHRDTEKASGMFATMVVVLPSAHAGGELIVRHAGREETFALHPEEPSELAFAAFYADCVHEVRPVTSGFRVALIFNLRFADDAGRSLKAPDFGAEETRAAAVLRDWAGDEAEQDKLIVPLEHAYTPAELAFDALKGADAGMASVLVAAAAAADCDLHLALVAIEETGGAEYAGYSRRGRWGRGDDEDDEGDDFEIGEIYDRTLTLSEWRRPDGGAAGFDDFPFTEDELCPPEAFEDLEPDEQHFHEATGNEGATVERTYRRAGLVLWPAARRLAVLNQAGLATTLPYLESLTARWEASREPERSALARDADELSGHMLGAWRISGPPGPNAVRMLDLQVRLGNAKRIDEFLSQVSAEGRYASSENEAILRAVALLPPARATALLAAIVARNAPSHLDACADLLARAVAALLGATLDLSWIAARLIAAMPGDPNTPRTMEPWAWRQQVTPGFVVALVSATSRIDAALAERAVGTVLAWPKTYALDTVLTPAALAFAKLPESRSWPAANRLRDAALAPLRARIALALEPPRDWRRDNAVTCRCGDCTALGAFLVDPGQREWRLRAAQDRRTHVEQTVKGAKCDLDLTTERRGSPHTLLAVKNDASYRRRAAQRREDLAHVAALGG